MIQEWQYHIITHARKDHESETKKTGNKTYTSGGGVESNAFISCDYIEIVLCFLIKPFKKGFFNVVTE